MLRSNEAMVASDSDEDDNKGRNIGFFFGNVDEDGHLEEDYLDEVWPTAAWLALTEVLHKKGILFSL